MKQTVVNSFAVAIEIVLMALVILPVWAFGSVHPHFELWVAYGIGIVLLLAAAWRWLGNRTEWLARPSSLAVAGGLYVLFLIATLQYLPMGNGVVAVLSPSTAAERKMLQPEKAEIVGRVPGAVVGEEPQSAAKSVQTDNAPATLSLNPSGSYYFSLRILGLVALFTVVCGLCRTELTQKPWLGSFLLRLSVIAAVLGTGLALFSIAQRFSSPPNKLYWFYDISMHGFGPFINRNHYPFFANMTLGLAVGLLLHRYEKRGSGWASLLINDNAALWIVGAIVFIIAGIVICVSRGGFVAMLAAVMLLLIARSRQGENLRTIATFTAVGAAVLLLLGWVGFDFLSSRLTTITDAEAIRESGRFSLWTSALQAGVRFPLFGSGGETYTYWESMLNQTDEWNSSNALATRCDNEFIDLFCEYGIFASLAALVIAVALLRRGFHLARHNGLAAGALMAMTAVIVHSCMDFGLRVPASGVLATIIAAALCSLPREGKRARKKSTKRERSQSRKEALPDGVGVGVGAGAPSQVIAKPVLGFSSAGAIGVGITCALVALFLVNEKRRLAASEAAYHLGLRFLVDGQFQRAAVEMERSTRIAPEDSKRHREVAGRMLEMSKASREPAEKLTLSRRGLEQAIIARDQCPLAHEPHLYLGQQHELLTSGDPQIAYFERARRLHPSNSDIAYGLGSLYYDQGNFEAAWPAWKASLQFVPNHLTQILDRSAKHLTVNEIIERILPAKPELFLRAADHSERVGRGDDRRVFLARVAVMLEQSADDDAAIHEMLARVYTQMDETEKAITSYRSAILLEPGQMQWRMELVKLLIKQERLEEAQREIRSLLVFEPDNVTVQAMKTRVEELMNEAKRKRPPAEKG